ncbi:MAG: hypothetical protein DWI22_20435 [Planctomycetota bacterium]|nr:MAG: hypothetical protein DWI22_20435 [Planctomycetota bacterium]
MPAMTMILDNDLECFAKFVQERLNSGLPLESLEEGLAEFRAWQSELVRFRTGLDQSLRQAAAGEAKILDSEAMKARILERLSATVDHT